MNKSCGMSIAFEGVKSVYRGSMTSGEAASSLLEGTTQLGTFGAKLTGKLFGALKKLVGGNTPPLRRSARLASKAQPRVSSEHASRGASPRRGKRQAIRKPR
jgi:hypothetical protein